MKQLLIFGICVETLIIGLIWAGRSLKSSTREIDWGFSSKRKGEINK